MPCFAFFVIRTFRAIRDNGRYIWQKNKKVNLFKRSNKVMFSWKKAKKLIKVLLLSLFIEMVFYLSEDIVCTCHSLNDPCNIETFHNGIILVFEIIVCLNNPPSMKKFQITQFEGYFNIAKCNSVWQLFANSISIPCLELVWDKFICWLVDANIQRLELVHGIVWNDNQLTVILCT